MTHANIQLPAALHDQMKAVRQARHEEEGADVKLCRIYREAVELYLSSDPVQRLLNGRRPSRKSLRATG
jgi:hypothetical protein